VRLCLSVISLTTCRLTDICKEVLHYFPDLFKFPPAKLLCQNSTGLASDFRLRSAFDVISSDPLSSDVSLLLSALNFTRVSFSSIHSAYTVGERSNFLTLALHPEFSLLMVARGLSNQLDLGTPA